MKRLGWLALLCSCVVSCQASVSAEPTPPQDEAWIPASSFEKGEARVVEARTQLLPQPIVADGRIAFDDQRVSHVFSPVTGRVTRVLAQLGQRVSKGTPLLAIVSPDVGSAVSDEVKARADLAAARHDFERQKRLFDEKAASSRDFESAEDNYRKARAEEERALQRLQLLRSGKVDEVTQEYILPSYIEGRVAVRSVNPGLEIQGQFSGGTAVELFTIGDIDSVWMFADVAESDVPEVRIGASVTVRVLAYPDRQFEGKVEWMSATLDPALRTARIRCSLSNPDRLLRPEMYATAFIDRPVATTLAIPSDAIVRIGDHSFVYVAAGARPDGRQVFKQRQVRVPERWGPADRQGAGVPSAEAGPVPVLTGLQEGEKVLVDSRRTGQHPTTSVSLTAEQSRKISTALAEQKDIPHSVTVGGRLTFDDMRVTHIFSPINGRVTRLLAAPGDRVKRGAPLAIILSPDLGSAFSDEFKAKADLVAAEHEVKRQREMFELKASARRDLETAEDNYDRTKAEYERAAQKTRLLREGAADSVSQQFVLRSPIDGNVVARTASPGLEVQGQYSGASNAVELFTIGRTDSLWLIGDVYESDLPHVKAGAELYLQVPAYPGRLFRGTVDWISDTLDPVQRTAKVRCVLENAQALLRPEMYGVVQIATTARPAVCVPRDALLRDGDDTVVFVEQGRRGGGEVTFSRRRVDANEQVPGDLVPVLSGLAPGERVATSGSIFLLGM